MSSESGLVADSMRHMGRGALYGIGDMLTYRLSGKRTLEARIAVADHLKGLLCSRRHRISADDGERKKSRRSTFQQ